MRRIWDLWWIRCAATAGSFEVATALAAICVEQSTRRLPADFDVAQVTGGDYGLGEKIWQTNRQKHLQAPRMRHRRELNPPQHSRVPRKRRRHNSRFTSIPRKVSDDSRRAIAEASLRSACSFSARRPKPFAASRPARWRSTRWFPRRNGLLCPSGAPIAFSLNLFSSHLKLKR